MHETALVRDLVRRIDQLARAAGASHVIGAKVWLGALSHLSAEHFREHFAIEARDTLANTAALEIEMSERSDRSACPACAAGERRTRRGTVRGFRQPSITDAPLKAVPIGQLTAIAGSNVY